VLGVALAIAISRLSRGRGPVVSLLVLPMMVAPALLGIMFRLLLNDFVGPITQLLQLAGHYISPLSPQYVVPTLFLIDVVMWTPFVLLITYAGVEAVPQDMLEAAAVDGANTWQAIRHITLPTIRPVVAVAALLRAIDAFKTFDTIQVLTGGGPGTLTTTVSVYIYRVAFGLKDLGQASAAAVLLLLILAIPLGVIVKRLVELNRG